jgi:hypothetical protein
MKFGHSVKIELNTIVKTLSAECFHRPSFTDLASAFQQNGLSRRTIFPCLKDINDVALNIHRSTLFG